MADMDPVSWDDIEAATGPPSATEVDEYVEAMTDEVGEAQSASESRTESSDAYEAVMTVYDEWKTDLGEERGLPDQAAAFVVAYLLEREGVIDLSDAPQGSLVERHPGEDDLRERFWDDEQTLWWMAVELGVHYSLVTFWLWEADIPLAERNLSDETMRQVQALTDDSDE